MTVSSKLVISTMCQLYKLKPNLANAPERLHPAMRQGDFYHL